MKSKFLIIEDLQDKMELIVDVLSQQFEFEQTWTRSIASAYSALPLDWDLIFLDMIFPSPAGHSYQDSKFSLAGIEILQYIQTRSIRTPVIVVTSHGMFHDGSDSGMVTFGELEALLIEGFSQNFRGLVRVDQNSQEWQNELKKLVGEALGRQSH